MEIIWQIDPEDVAKVQVFFNEHRDSAFVTMRMENNLSEDKPPVSKEAFWERMIGCLLTSQQRSGPDSPVSHFIRSDPFPLNYKICNEQPYLANFARQVLSEFGGLRFSTTIGERLAVNKKYLESGGWEHVNQHLDRVRLQSSPEVERLAAAFIDHNLKGFGPKQSRNLLQGLGISRYEIPIDSRITKWLNAFGFPVKLTANALQDTNYYNFVSDGFQRLCEACEIMPCALDAAIFSSFDEGKWTEENAVW